MKIGDIVVGLHLTPENYRKEGFDGPTVTIGIASDTYKYGSFVAIPAEQVSSVVMALVRSMQIKMPE